MVQGGTPSSWSGDDNCCVTPKNYAKWSLKRKGTKSFPSFHSADYSIGKVLGITECYGMNLTTALLNCLRLRFKDTKGQDLIEYALMAGFVAVAAGAIMPGVADSISEIFSSVASVISGAASEG